MTPSLTTVAYIGAIILFILSLGGLSNPETSRRGNLYGIIGMTIAVLATIFGPRVGAAGIPWIVGAMVAGGAVGLYAARTVQMTQMPELVAIMHSLVGLAACLVGYASYVDTSFQFTGAEKAIHEIEIYIGVLIGAVTFSGSVIAFGKLSAKISGKPMLIPGRHWLNLIGLLLVHGWRTGGARGTALRAGMTRYLVYILVFSLIAGAGIDHLNHAGGLICGALLGLVVRAGAFRGRGEAATWGGMAVLGVLLVLWSFYRVAVPALT